MVYEKILPTPSHEEGKGVWTFYGSATIDAPAEQVWEAAKDFQSYPQWNLYTVRSGTPSGTNAINVGDIVTLAYRPEPKGDTMDIPCEMLYVSDEKMEICWRGKAMSIPMFIFLPEKIQKVTRKGENQCVYEIWETQSGPMAYVIKWAIGQQLSRMNKGIADGLKGYVEEKRKQNTA
ncbi:hypothetical protein NA57DRAFT_57605 [Rhizodiscina lignyota]|uniref:SRPBCC domain-containing protein n=1 Tax=Rhizodiscina lignyota TaxID=1504668 RepID=A0A9P4I8J4_9PEZI|nr:hypothetical protein NA57DRAFT_57605 [Rhizodiscina lignyota]